MQAKKQRWHWMVAALVLAAAFSAVARAGGFEIGDPVEPSLGMSTGSWADSVPIETAPAPGGAAPRLALSADHRAGDGPLGPGWNLTGTSIITRHSTGGGVPNYSEGDLYRLDGEPLTWVKSPSPAHWEAETWDGGRLDYDSGSNTWTRKKDGWTWTYGSKSGTGVNSTQLLSSANGRSQQHIPAPNEIAVWHTPAGTLCFVGATSLCNTASWRLSLVSDPFGNTITYDYTVPTLPAGLQGGYWYDNSRNPLLSEVRFAQNNAKVKFVYVDRPDQRIRVDSGTPSFLVKRLSAIESTGKTSLLVARYELEYNDQAGTKCDGSQAWAITRPRASILRRITRTGVAGAPPRHVVRCLETNTEMPAWDDDTAASEVSSVIAAPFGGFNTSSDSVIPLSLHLDRDGVTDLLLLGLRKSGSSVSIDHRAYVGTPAAANPFADATGSGVNDIVAAEWQSLANEAIDDSLLEDERGWGIADLDKDGVSELIVEKANYVKRRWFDTVGGARHIETLNLAGCDLRYGSFADVDGDGLADLVRRAHDESEDGVCAAQTTTVWFRNTGSAPWLDSAFAEPFKAPLEGATLPAEWRALTSAGGVCASGVVPPPPDSGPTPSDEAFVAAHARIGDYNGDGLADIAYALHACWYLDANGDWQPTYGSDYSHMFWGDGYGEFINSGQAAGMPMTTYGNDVGSWRGVSETHMYAPFFSVSDVDRDGAPELLSTGLAFVGSGTHVMGSFFRGIDEGFGQFVAGEAWDGTYLDVTQDFLVYALDYVGQAWSCYEDTVVPALGDYDGDGFDDILTFENHDNAATAVCPQGSWCVVYRKNKRAAGFGRITRSYNTWGGATDLEWGSSALGDNKNPDLPTVMEVLTAVSGPEGRVELSYSGGALSNGSPTPFTTVERLNARGGLDQFEFAVTDALAGLPVYAARRRTDGTLEHVTVYIHGRMSLPVALGGSGYQVDVAVPYVNPLLRQCDFELSYAASGGQSTTIDELIDDCFEWGGFSGGLLHEFGVLTGHTTAIPMNDPRAVYLKDLVWKHNAPRAEQGEDPRDADAVAMMSRGANYPAALSWDPGPLDNWPADNTDPIAPDYEWPLPSGVNPPPVIQPGRGYQYPLAVNNARRFYVTDWSFDSTNHKMTRVAQRRDTSTTADDLVETPTWEQPDSTGHWYRMTADTMADANGVVLATSTRSVFVGFDSATHVVTCGGSGAPLKLCKIEDETRDSHGDLLSHTYPDRSRESWTRSWCGSELKHTDPLNRVATSVWDNRCLLTSSTVGGEVTTKDYDALLRETSITVDPNGTAPTRTWTLAYDDHYTHPDDTLYQEPRSSIRRSDGQLEMSYRDGFGRLTKRTTCSGTGGAGQIWGCTIGTTRTDEWSLFGGDGLLQLSIAPHAPGEALALTQYGHDGYGRVISVQSPANISAGGAFRTTFTYYKLGAVDTVAPDSQVSTVSYTTLSEATKVAGVARGSRTLDVLGRTASWVGPDGVRVDYTRDGFGRVTQIAPTTDVSYIDSLGVARMGHPVRTFTHDLGDRVLHETAGDGTAIDHTYDAGGRPLTLKIANVLVQSYAYGASGATPTKVTVTDESGMSEVHEFDSNGSELSATRLGLTERWTYGVNGKVATYVDRDGLTTAYAYDNHDRIKTLARPGRGTANVTWTGGDRLATFSDADGVVDTYSYARSGLMLGHRRGPWTLESRTYDAVGRIRSDVTDGIRSEYLYDSLGRATTVRQGVSGGVATAIEQFTYTARDQVATHSLSPVAGGAALTIYTYNGLGWLTSAVRPTGTTSYAHDLMGRLRSVTDGEGYKRSRKYDSRGRITSFELPGRGNLTVGYTVPATYSAVGGLSLVTVTDEELNQSKTWVDALGRTIATQRPDSTSIVNSWSGSRLSTQAWLSAAGATLRERRHQYDAEGRTSAILGPAIPTEFAGTVYSMGLTYSSAGRVLTTTVPDETTIFTYANGLLATEKYQNLTRTLSRTDPTHSWVVSEDLQQGTAGTVRRRTYARDALGRLLSETITNGTGVTEVNSKSGLDVFGHPATELSTLNGVVQVQHNWTFDQRGRPTQRVTATAGVPNMTTRWSWYRNDVLKTVRNPSGVALGFAYGTPFDHKLRAVYDANVPVTQTQHAVFDAWNARGMPTHLLIKATNDDVGLTYDSMGHLKSKQVSQFGAPVMTWSGVRDDLGKLVSETIKPSGIGWTNSYRYDSFGRLTSEVRGKTGDSIAYTYSLAGNRTRKQITHTTGAIETATATYSGSRLNTYQASAGAPIISIPYDAWNGALTDTRGNTFTRTPGGKELTIKGGPPTVTIARDAAGLPVRMAEGGKLPRVTIWDLDPGKLPLEVRQSDGTVLDYMAGNGMLLGRFENGLPDFDEEHTGPQGSVLRFEGAMLDDATAFGDGLIQPAGTDERFLFAGLELVPSAPGVLLARQRAYDPAVGRWLSPDPLGLGGGMHRTVYARSDPVQNQDPLGLVSCGGGTPNLGLQPLDLVRNYEMMSSGAGPSMFAQIDALKAAASFAAWAKSLADNLKIGNSSPIPFGPDPCGYTGCKPTGGEGFAGGFGGSSAVKNDKGSDDLDSKSDIRHRERDAKREAKDKAKYNAKYQKKDHREFPFDLATADLTEGRPLRDPDDPEGLNWDFVPAGPAEAEQPGKTPPIEASPVDPPPVTPPPPAPGGGGGIRINLGGGGSSDGTDYHPTAENLGKDRPPAMSTQRGDAPRGEYEVQVPEPDEPPPPPTITGEPHRTTSPATQGPRPRPAPRLPAERDDAPVSVPVRQNLGGHSTGEGSSPWQRLKSRIDLRRTQWLDEYNWVPGIDLSPTGPFTGTLTLPSPFGTVSCTSMGCDFSGIWDRIALSPGEVSWSEGPAKVTAKSNGEFEISLSEGGATVTCSSKGKNCQIELSRELTIGFVGVTVDPISHLVTLSVTARGGGVSIGVSQSFQIESEMSPEEIQRRVLKKLGLDPIVEAMDPKNR